MIGARIREHRTKLGMSQTELSSLTDIPQTTISCWERGIGEPKISDAQKLAQALQTTLDELLKPETNEISLDHDSTTEPEATQPHERTA